MKKLEGQPAIDYLKRLISVKDLDRGIYQHSLLFTMLKIELAVLTSLPEKNDGRYLFVTSNGFPSLPTTLARVKYAIGLHYRDVNRRQRQVERWLEAITNLSPDQIREQSQVLSQKQNPSPEIADAFMEVSSKEVKYLHQINFKEEHQYNNHIFPLYTVGSRQSLLFANRNDTPFQKYPNSYPEANFRKYIDSPTASENIVFGSETEPILWQNRWEPPKHARIPILITGSIDYGGKGEARIDSRSFTPSVTAYIQRSSQEGKKRITIEKEEHRSYTDHQVGKLIKPETPLSSAILDIDFTNLSDQATDQLLESLPQITTFCSEIAAQAESMAKNQVFDFVTTDSKAQQLASLVSSIENSSARQAIQVAVKKMLDEIKNDLYFSL